MSAAMEEWAKFNKLFNAGASRSELIKAAEAMMDSDNRSVAKIHLGIMTSTERKEIDARWASINAVTEKEMRAHCQLDGLFAL